jgi:DNA-directed RNA polymerase specialized sigma24 family protein
MERETDNVTPASFERWCHAYVYRQLGVTNDHDDYVQEMLYAMFVAEGKYVPALGAKPSWLIRAAISRFKNLAFGTGRPLSSVKSTRQRRVGEAHWDDLSVPAQQEYEPTCEIAEYAIMAYHRGELHQALDDLSPGQQQAAHRIMMDQHMTNTDRAHWSRARPKLAAKLQHLRELV